MASKIVYRASQERRLVDWTRFFILAALCWLLGGCTVLFDKKLDPKTGLETIQTSAVVKDTIRAAEPLGGPWGILAGNIAITLLNSYANWRNHRAIRKVGQGKVDQRQK